jgi:hypothetical protein
MIHASEDCNEEHWPVNNWYRFRLFKIVDGDFTQSITVRERRLKWAMFYPEFSFQKDLIDFGILKYSKSNSSISLCESSDLMTFLSARINKCYPYKIPFWFKK